MQQPRPYSKITLNFQLKKTKALEPKYMFCTILERKVTVLQEYSDYKNRNNKGAPSTYYCENIIPCYGNGKKCRYSGISPLYPDPLVPVEFASLNKDDE